jgi:hypothetical protein
MYRTLVVPRHLRSVALGLAAGRPGSSPHGCHYLVAPRPQADTGHKGLYARCKRVVTSCLLGAPREIWPNISDQKSCLVPVHRSRGHRTTLTPGIIRALMPGVMRIFWESNHRITDRCRRYLGQVQARRYRQRARPPAHQVAG